MISASFGGRCTSRMASHSCQRACAAPSTMGVPQAQRSELMPVSPIAGVQEGAVVLVRFRQAEMAPTETSRIPILSLRSPLQNRGMTFRCQAAQRLLQRPDAGPEIASSLIGPVPAGAGVAYVMRLTPHYALAFLSSRMRSIAAVNP